MQSIAAEELEELLGALGAHLQEAGEGASIFVVGGAALCLRGWVQRTTRDVDVLALHGEAGLVPPELPPALLSAIHRVARDFGLDENWLNATVGLQWHAGLPPDVTFDVEWREYDALRVGLAGRQTLITLKLFAALDQGPASVHVQDLVTLRASAEELARAKEWVSSQDLAPQVPQFLNQVIRHVRSRE